MYSNAAIIGANLDPISGDEPGETPLAAAIFLHRHSYAANGSTRGLSGCVSLSQAELEHTLRTIDPALDPHFAIGPADYLLTTARHSAPHPARDSASTFRTGASGAHRAVTTSP